jgi:hypothetical protein
MKHALHLLTWAAIGYPVAARVVPAILEKLEAGDLDDFWDVFDDEEASEWPR